MAQGCRGSVKFLHGLPAHIGERLRRARRPPKVPTCILWTYRPKEASLSDIGEGPTMDDDRRELANRLFAAVTAMLEDAIEVAVAGQSPKLDPRQLANRARRLYAAAQEIAAMAEAAMIVANSGVSQGQNPRNCRH